MCFHDPLLIVTLLSCPLTFN